MSQSPRNLLNLQHPLASGKENQRATITKQLGPHGFPKHTERSRANNILKNADTRLYTHIHTYTCSLQKTHQKHRWNFIGGREGRRGDNTARARRARRASISVGHTPRARGGKSSRRKKGVKIKVRSLLSSAFPAKFKPAPGRSPYRIRICLRAC